MKKTLYILLSFIVLTTIGCTNGTFTISGQIVGGENKVIWIDETTVDGIVFIDSITLDDNGKFRFKYKMPYRSFYNIHSSKSDFIVLLPNYGEHITIDGKYDSLYYTYTVEGSEESMLLWELQGNSMQGAETVKNLVDSTRHYQNLLQVEALNDQQYKELKDDLDTIFFNTLQQQKEYVCNFIRENSGSLATIIALYQSFNSRSLIDPRNEESLEYFDITLEGLEQTLPDNPHTIKLSTAVQRLHNRFNSEERGIER